MRTTLLTAATVTSALSLVAFSSFAVEAKLYGTVNKAFMGYDDGRSTESTVVDNNLESTRFGLAVEQPLDNGLTASALFEVEHNSNPSNAITQGINGNITTTAATPASIAPSLSERIARVGLAGSWGAVFIGQQDVATDDAYGHDLAAANSVLNANIASWGGGLKFQTNTGGVYSNLNVAGTNLTPGVFALGNDGALASADSIRYNTPNWNGLNGSASLSQGGNVDVTARYAATLGDFQIDSAIGYTAVQSRTTPSPAVNVNESNLMASASVKHNSGLAATVAYTTQNLENKQAGVNDPEGYYAKLGYAWDSYGVAVDYGHFKDPVASATIRQELDAYGVAGEWTLTDGVVAGAVYRNFATKVTGVSNDDDINLFALNMRVKF